MDLNNVGAVQPPEGEVANFRSPLSSEQIKFIIVYSVTLGLATFTLLLRLYTRAVIVKRVWLDDYAVIVAWFANIAALVVTLIWMKQGFGQHIWNISIAMFLKYLKITAGVITAYSWALALCKFSLLLTYLRINPDRVFTICTYILMAIIFCYTLITNVISVTYCKPTDLSKSQCLSSITFWQGILNIITDGLIVVLPLPMIYKLQIRFAQKVSLALLFMAGSLVVIASIVRVVLLHSIPITSDATWAEVDASIWSVIEINVAVMCSSLMVIRPLLGKVFGRKFASNGDSRTVTNNSRFWSWQKSLHQSRNKSNSYRLDSMDEASKWNARVTTEIRITKSDDIRGAQERERSFGTTSPYDLPRSRVYEGQRSVGRSGNAY